MATPANQSASVTSGYESCSKVPGNHTFKLMAMRYLFFTTIVFLMAQCKSSSQTTTSTAHLENTYWKLSEMNGMPVVTPADAKEVYFIMTAEGADKRIKGFAGCNSLGGSYTLDGNKIKFTTITTRMMCHDRMDIENYLVQVLSNADSYKITGETLELYRGNTFLAKFDSVYLK